MTVLYAAVFFVAGAVLVALMMLYLAHALDGQMAARIGAAERAVELPPQVRQELRVQFQRDRDHVLAAMLTASLVSLGAIGVIAAALGWFVADRALRPLQQISATARRIADRNLHERIALTGRNDEIKDLADAIDAMLDRLDRSFDSQRRFVANASHELRTPLTLNRTLIEVTLDAPHTSEAVRQLGTTLLAVNDRHEHLIDGLLTLATSEQRIAQPAPVDLAEIARHLTRERQADADRAGIDISTDLRPAPVTGDPVLLERLAHNLIDNAIRYNLPSHGAITIATDTVDGRAPHRQQHGAGCALLRDSDAVPAFPAPSHHRTTRRTGGLPPPRSGPRPVHRRRRGARPWRRRSRPTR